MAGKSSKRPKLGQAFDACRDMRRKRILSGTVSAKTGVRVITGERWVEEPCGVPLFTQADRQAGRCQWCVEGHNHEDNQAVKVGLL